MESLESFHVYNEWLDRRFQSQANSDLRTFPWRQPSRYTAAPANWRPKYSATEEINTKISINIACDIPRKRLRSSSRKRWSFRLTLQRERKRLRERERWEPYFAALRKGQYRRLATLALDHLFNEGYLRNQCAAGRGKGFCRVFLRQFPRWKWADHLTAWFRPTIVQKWARYSPSRLYILKEKAHIGKWPDGAHSRPSAELLSGPGRTRF